MAGTDWAARSSARATIAPLRGRKIRLEPESTPLVEIPPRHGTGTIDLGGFLDRSSRRDVAAMTDRRAENIHRPTDEVAFGVGRSEARELHDLVDPDLPLSEGIRHARKRLERIRRTDPPASLPMGDAVAHRQPVGGVASARVPPHVAAVDLGDQGEEIALRIRHPCV